MVDLFTRPGASKKHADDHRADPSAMTLGASDVRRGAVGDIAVTATGRTLTTHPGDDSVAVLNARTLAVEAIIAVHGEPFAVAVHDDRAYVSTSSWTHKDEVTVIDTTSKTVIASYPLAENVTALAVSPDGKRVYAGRTGDGHIDVAVIDIPADRVGTIDVATGAGIGIDALAVDPDGERLYVATTDARGSAVVVVDIETARVAHAVRIGSPIRDIAIADDTAFVLSSDRARGGVLHVIELATGRVTGVVELGGAPTQLAVGADKSRAYVVDYDRVVVVCTLTLQVINDITVSARPSCVAVDSHNGRLYVADYDGHVSAFAVETTMPLLYSQFMATDPIVADYRELEPVHA
ncbi:40-residue YVTN family beta-propeller repeat-containing protein [Mycolicibacterium rutilum]|uniref:40-residue YVTN family beta-propeller repeat-containing protein n=1 Tax=Mycolicibacterium rutilum TaxID=370526 RepID=A0A1H6K538_MYCRU|nr:YncE family protein [Mycolicibacterium rutilum]SEH67501.1 40-residue YVTN family beta-propeller repeat-containing protein [Mycolicibacterium rutilum]